MNGVAKLVLVRVQSINTKDDSKHGSHMATPSPWEGFTFTWHLESVPGSERCLSQQIVPHSVPSDLHSELGLAVLHSKREL